MFRWFSMQSFALPFACLSSSSRPFISMLLFFSFTAFCFYLFSYSPLWLRGYSFSVLVKSFISLFVPLFTYRRHFTTVLLFSLLCIFSFNISFFSLHLGRRLHLFKLLVSSVSASRVCLSHSRLLCYLLLFAHALELMLMEHLLLILGVWVSALARSSHVITKQRRPLIRIPQVFCLNTINQSMLSLKKLL